MQTPLERLSLERPSLPRPGLPRPSLPRPSLPRLSLKRIRSVAFSSPLEQTHASASSDAVGADDDPAFHTSGLLDEVLQSLASGRTSSAALVAVFDELNAMPGVALAASEQKDHHDAAPRERQVRNLILLDHLFEAAQKARAKAREAWALTPWEQQRSNNFCVLDGQVDSDNECEDGCGVCGVAKSECMKPDEHFGAQGESPPYVKCSKCSLGFCNLYDSPHQLRLHLLQHAAKEAQ